MTLPKPDTVLPSESSEAGSTRLHLLVTAEAVADPADPSDAPRSAVGISTDPVRPGWIRLHPLDPDDRIRPYDIVTVDARRPAAPPDPEIWRPTPRTLRVSHHLKQWRLRQRWLDPHVEGSMCELERRSGPPPVPRSLALVRPREVTALEIDPQPGLTAGQWRRPGHHRWLPTAPGRPVPAGGPPPPTAGPARFRGAYRYRCHEPGCPGHRQRILDREFVALQQRLAELPDDRLRRALENTFLTRLCGPDRATAFYVGTRTDRPGGFRVLGVYWPLRASGH
ncbi:hypothetical protein ACFOX0_07130 [Micromonospora zhanjiangensis]|uniref:Uncharacterized protein n=1 Tax=Micromonospora zhanjiangensis TaxID=1522057 RepID=A0ABV8KI76_9ACTN